MKIRTALALLLVLGGVVLLSAQEDQFIILYSNSTSGITHLTASGKQRPVFPGVNLPAEGRLQLKADAWVNVLFDGHKKRLDGPAVIDLAFLAKTIVAEGNSSFMGRFLKYLGNSVNQVNDSKRLEKYHQEYMANTRAATSGFGNQEDTVQFPGYLTETLAESSILFRWDSIAGSRGYTFTITDRSVKQSIFRALTKGNQLSVDIGALLLAEGEVYQWKVEAQLPDGTGASSPFAYFSYEPGELKAFIEKVEAGSDYQELEPFERELYLLHELEEEGFFHAAYTEYRELLEKEDLHLLHKKLFAAFLARMNALGEARSVLEYPTE